MLPSLYGLPTCLHGHILTCAAYALQRAVGLVKASYAVCGFIALGSHKTSDFPLKDVISGESVYTFYGGQISTVNATFAPVTTIAACVVCISTTQGTPADRSEWPPPP